MPRNSCNYQRKGILNSKENCANIIRLIIGNLLLMKVHNRTKVQKPYASPYKMVDIRSSNPKRDIKGNIEQAHKNVIKTYKT